MTVQEFTAHIDEAIARSLRCEGYIDKEVTEIRGFSTLTMRRLFSNLTHFPDGRPVVYTEAGLFGGGSFISAINNNPCITAYGIEDSSQPFGDPEITAHLKENIAKYYDQADQVMIFWEDFFKMDLNKIKYDSDIFFYDAEHSQESQRKAWSHFEDKLSNVALVIVDDYQWEPVWKGSREGIVDIASKRRIVKEWALDDGVNNSSIWWNGVLLALTERIK